MAGSGSAAARVHGGHWVAPIYWGVVGVLGAFGVAGLATVGLFLLALAAVLVAVALVVPALRSPSVPGVLVGMSAAPLYIAWLNHSGPGTICTTTGDTAACTDEWSPWPFVAAGLVLVGAGIAWLTVARRRASRVASPESPAAAGSVGQT